MMAIDYDAYRASESEQARIRDLFSLIPEQGQNVLDIGSRDGYLSLMLAERFEHVVALDLEKPSVSHPKIECVQGNACQLEYPDCYFEIVVCAEVLEHIPAEILEQVCAEISRVARRSVIIGVPYRQDIRFGKTTCSCCGKTNPPWGHINSFDEDSLKRRFPHLTFGKHTYVGSTLERTNFISAALMSYAGNPYGTYSQEEPCIYCGNPLGDPHPRSLLKKVATKIAFNIETVHKAFAVPRPNWIHVVFEK